MTLVLSLVQSSVEGTLPFEPPISGPFWTIAIPSVLLLVAFLGTFLLYRHFAGKDDTNPV